MADGKIKLNIADQIGAGKSSHSFIVPVDRYINQSEDQTAKQPAVKLVSTTEQMVDQAKSELKREGEDSKDLSRTAKRHKRNSKRRKTSRLKILKKKKLGKSSVKTKKPKRVKTGRKTNTKSRKPTRGKRDFRQKSVASGSKHKRLNYIPKDSFDS